MESFVNVLITTFNGLPLPATLCLPLPSALSSHSLLDLVGSLLPDQVIPCVYLTTLDNKVVAPSRTVTIADLASSKAITQCCTSKILALRLSVPLVGGKGGFGSQLRAAGGRMSSRKRKQNAELASGSARNLDGRRLRTVTEAKNLATYLATRPEMDRKDKEERRKRWEQVIELAEQREADMRAGKTADGRRKGLSEEWIQEKEEVGDNVKNAVKLALAVASEAKSEDISSKASDSDESPSDSPDDESDMEPMELDEEEMLRLREEAESGDTDAIWVLKNKLKIPSSYLPQEKTQTKRFAGFDDDLSSDEESDAGPIPDSSNKGKSVLHE